MALSQQFLTAQSTHQNTAARSDFFGSTVENLGVEICIPESETVGRSRAVADTVLRSPGMQQALRTSNATHVIESALYHFTNNRRRAPSRLAVQLS